MKQLPESLGTGLLCGLFALVLGIGCWQISGQPVAGNLPALVEQAMPASGVTNPVTAVLLNFRSYDTLLEIGVLVIAGIIGISLAGSQTLEDPDLRTADSLLHALQRWFVPLMVLVSAYLLWAGASRPGGAFQAGALLAATGVLMRLGGFATGFLQPPLLLRLGLVLGFTVFLLVALVSAMVGEAFLAYPPGFAKGLILVIETGLTLSIAMILLSLFVAAPVNVPRPPGDGADRRRMPRRDG